MIEPRWTYYWRCPKCEGAIEKPGKATPICQACKVALELRWGAQEALAPWKNGAKEGTMGRKEMVDSAVEHVRTRA